ILSSGLLTMPLLTRNRRAGVRNDDARPPNDEGPGQGSTEFQPGNITHGRDAGKQRHAPRALGVEPVHRALDFPGMLSDTRCGLRLAVDVLIALDSARGTTPGVRCLRGPSPIEAPANT